MGTTPQTEAQTVALLKASLAMSTLRELVDSLAHSHVEFDHQFAVGLQYKGAARRAMVRRMRARYLAAIGAALKLVSP